MTWSMVKFLTMIFVMFVYEAVEAKYGSPTPEAVLVDFVVIVQAAVIYTLEQDKSQREKIGEGT